MIQWLRLSASTVGGMGSIPGQGTKIPHAARCGQKKKKMEGEILNILQTEKTIGFIIF